MVEALNAGLAAATGELVVQLDADASVETPGWVERMVGFFAADERVGVVTGEDRVRLGRDAHLRRRHGRPRRLPRPRRRDHRAAGAAHATTSASSGAARTTAAICDRVAEVDGGIGCCMMYRREAALELGRLRPRWAPVWFDDLDLTMCMRREGLKVFYLPDVRVIHHVGRRLEDERRSLRLRTPCGAQARRRDAARRRCDGGSPSGLGLDIPPPDIWERLQHHYAYWREKWGWDILNPDMDALLERWGDTEVCWRYDEGRRAAGEQIVAAYEAP